MTPAPALSRSQLDRLQRAATVLLPGSSQSPAAQAVTGLDDLIEVAAAALAGVEPTPAEAIDALPEELTRDTLRLFCEQAPAAFEVVSLLAAGAYFMAPAVLAALELPTGRRRRADPEQIVRELGTGLLDAVIERGAPVRTLDQVNGQVR